VRLDHETLWLSLNQAAELFNRDKSVISRHIKNIFKEEELNPKSTVTFFATVQEEGKRKINREIEYCNLKRPVDEMKYQIVKRFEFMNLPVATKQGNLFG